MPNWLKIVTSIGISFATGAITAKQSGAKTKGVLIGGAAGALLGLGNLVVTPPTTEEPVGEKK